MDKIIINLVFIRKIEAREITSEEGILNHFYEGKVDQKKNVSRLKNKLKDRLINTLFFIDINHTT